jgi:hypothetical protein
MGQLAARDGCSVVCQGEKVEACGLQPPQRPERRGRAAWWRTDR